MKQKKWFLCLLIPALAFQPLQAQILKRIKEKADQITNKVIDKKIDEKIGTTGGNNPGGAGNTGGKRKSGNNSGEGLVSSPPDVNAALIDAEAAYKKNQYGDSRYSVQQAMLGVEMMIGKEILKSLPDSIAPMKKDTTSDKVTSSGWGWVGLTMERDYRQNIDKDPKELSFMLANNAAWMQAINLYMSGGYAQSSGETQNWKQTRLKGNKGVIEYDKSSGYKLSIPLGQTSLLILEGVNFATEQDFMTACGAFDIDKIKEQLGEK